MMGFNDALLLIKAGGKMRRDAWHSGVFIFLVPGSTFQVNRPPLLGIYPEGTTITYHGHIDMRTWEGYITPWQPSQADMLSEDWIQVDDTVSEDDLSG